LAVHRQGWVKRRIEFDGILLQTGLSCILKGMALEISLQGTFNIPRLLRAQSDDSRRDYHWVRHKPDVELGREGPEDQNSNQKDQGRRQKYRPLAEITLGEVDDIYRHYERQLIVGQAGWIGKDSFCQIPLKRSKDGRPPMVFGRVKTAYPSDGFTDNVEELEVYFPRKDAAPDVLHIHGDEINRVSQKQVQSYFVQVRVLASTEEQVELTEADPVLRTKGFYPVFESGYLDLLEMTTQNQFEYPWMYVIGSRWFASVPESLQAEVLGRLKEMVAWGKQVFNYHPEWLTKEINALNRALGYKFGFTPVVLTEPGNAHETAFIVARTFEQEIFFKPMAEK
jgi:hypothetical protein